jgi:hypothetical protein
VWNNYRFFKEAKIQQDISKIERGRFSPRPRNNPIYYNGEIPFVQTNDVVNSNGKIEFFLIFNPKFIFSTIKQK